MNGNYGFNQNQKFIFSLCIFHNNCERELHHQQHEYFHRHHPRHQLTFAVSKTSSCFIFCSSFRSDIGERITAWHDDYVGDGEVSVR